MKTVSDREWLLGVLADGREHTLADIIRRSFDERGHGLTVHSRAAELRSAGYTIENRPMPNGRRGSIYQLTATPLEEAAATGLGTAAAAASSSGSTPRGAAPDPSSSAAAPEPLTLFPETRGAYSERAA